MRFNWRHVLSVLFLSCSGLATLAQVLVFEDSFDQEGVWDSRNLNVGRFGYKNGWFQIYIDKPDSFIYVPAPVLPAKDVRLEVDISKRSGAMFDEAGVFCRLQLEGGHYELMFSAEARTSAIYRVNGDEYVAIGRAVLPPEIKLNSGVKPNHLRAECVGSKLRLFVNDWLTLEAQDSNFEGGWVGLAAGTGTKVTQLTADFDNFKLFVL
jgi:hypothetical protein